MIDLNEIIINAARKGNLEVLTEVISQQADINAKDEKGYTP
jgi:ankyrin repeat protein